MTAAEREAAARRLYEMGRRECSPEWDDLHAFTRDAYVRAIAFAEGAAVGRGGGLGPVGRGGGVREPASGVGLHDGCAGRGAGGDRRRAAGARGCSVNLEDALGLSISACARPDGVDRVLTSVESALAVARRDGLLGA